MPTLSAIGGLPWQVAGASVNHVWILGIHRHRYEIPHRSVVLEDVRVLTRHLLPSRPTILRTEHSIQCPDHQGVVIARRHRQGADGFAVYSRQRAPGGPTVIGASG